MPRRALSKVEELEDRILPPEWLPVSHEQVWNSLPPYIRTFLKGGGGSSETVNMFMSLLPDDKRESALEKLQAIVQR